MGCGKVLIGWMKICKQREQQQDEDKKILHIIVTSSLYVSTKVREAVKHIYFIIRILELM